MSQSFKPTYQLVKDTVQTENDSVVQDKEDCFFTKRKTEEEREERQ